MTFWEASPAQKLLCTASDAAVVQGGVQGQPGSTVHSGQLRTTSTREHWPVGACQRASDSLAAATGLGGSGAAGIGRGREGTLGSWVACDAYACEAYALPCVKTEISSYPKQPHNSSVMTDHQRINTRRTCKGREGNHYRAPAGHFLVRIVVRKKTTVSMKSTGTCSAHQPTKRLRGWKRSKPVVLTLAN